MSLTLIIDGQHISLDESADVAALTTQIAEAVRRGGDFVHIEGTHGLTLDILVTPRTRATIRTFTNSAEPGASETGWPPSVELDF